MVGCPALSEVPASSRFEFDRGMMGFMVPGDFVLASSMLLPCVSFFFMAAGSPIYLTVLDSVPLGCVLDKSTCMGIDTLGVRVEGSSSSWFTPLSSAVNCKIESSCLLCESSSAVSCTPPPSLRTFLCWSLRLLAGGVRPRVYFNGDEPCLLIYFCGDSISIFFIYI